MRVFIAGVDGYLGWTLAQYLTARGHDVGGADRYLRRRWVAEMGSQSATPIADMNERLEAFQERFGRNASIVRTISAKLVFLRLNDCNSLSCFFCDKCRSSSSRTRANANQIIIKIAHFTFLVLMSVSDITFYNFPKAS